MHINLKLHSKTLVIKSIIGQFFLPFNNLNYLPDELIVVNYHSTPKKFILNFEHQLKIFKNYFDIISPKNLEDYFEGNLNSKKPKLIYTFDDGIKNNVYAAEVLKKNNVQGLFFLVPDFIETKSNKQKEYYSKNIRYAIDGAIDSEEEDLMALSWQEIEQLISAGHLIGSHSQTHTMLGGRLSEEQAKNEIIGSKNYLESKTGVRINSFCSINDTLLSVGKLEKRLIHGNYDFHFTTLPGYNSINKSRLFIKRRNVECFWPDGAIYFAIGKSDLGRWSKKIEAYNRI
jgi:peptidoglycan/xylan/chitin deacetylase (PgdA/CDA1 family)